jgi:hypothetical protein
VVVVRSCLLLAVTILVLLGLCVLFAEALAAVLEHLVSVFLG